MIRPDAIPLLAAPSRATLDARTVELLFGGGYRLRGSERVRLAAGHSEIWVPATSGGELRVELDAVDRDALGQGPLRVGGPRGHAPVPLVEPVRRALVLPPALRRAWGAPDVVTLQGGAVAFGGVPVVEGPDVGARLDRADRLAAGLAGGDTVRWRRDLDLAVAADPVSDPKVRSTGRLITETDVRQARLRGQRIVVQPGQLLTPAARSLARDLGVIDPPT